MKGPRPHTSATVLLDWHTAALEEVGPGGFLPLKVIAATMYEGLHLENRVSVYNKLVLLDDLGLVTYKPGEGATVHAPSGA